MSGPIGLHGGGEYLAGDEPFLDALIGAAVRAAERRSLELDVAAHDMATEPAPIRIVVVPTAASRGLPDRAAATGVEAFERRAATAGLPVRVNVARIVDPASAWDPDLVAFHEGGGSPVTTRWRVQELYRSRFRLLRKHGLIRFPGLLRTAVLARLGVESLLLAGLGRVLFRDAEQRRDKALGRRELIRLVRREYR